MATGLGSATAFGVNRALERVKERETSNLRRGLPYLGTVASATPFIGLLGTVIGILGTFQMLRGGTVGITEIGPKISEALVSTALGLGVAIIAAMAFNFFTSRVEQFVIDMNDVSSEFIDFVLREGTCRVGITVGYAIAPRDGADAAQLLRRADAAMYGGKQEGKGRVRRAMPEPAPT